jgi:hypothetical protein
LSAAELLNKSFLAPKIAGCPGKTAIIHELCRKCKIFDAFL